MTERWQRREARENMCAGKVRFLNHETAAAGRQRMADDHEDPTLLYRLTIYSCRHCGNVHLGNRPDWLVKKIEKSKAKRAERARRKALWRSVEGS